MHVSSNGIFTPPLSSGGPFTLTYTANGCSSTKNVYVDNPITNNPDTVCQSLGPFALNSNPPGGRWSGPGITNAIDGTFEASRAGPGAHTLTYSLNGCDFTEDIFVKTISAGNDFVLVQNKTLSTCLNQIRRGAVGHLFLGPFLIP